jgi:hypothetical protein
MTNALSDGISALVDSCWSRPGGAWDCRHCIVKSNAEPPEDDNLEQEVAQPEERAVRHLGLDALTARRPAPQRRHVGFGPGLIDEHQPCGIDPIPIPGPLRPPTGDIGTILLGSISVFFCN